MGLHFQTCSCLKSGQEEKKSEFYPDSINMFNSNNTKINTNRNRHLSLSSEIRDSNLPSSTSREKTNFLLKGDNKTFSFRYLEKAKTINPESIQIIQAIFRAFLYRKNFFKNKGIKELLKKSSEEIIHEKESEYINENLIETDKIIKKEFNDGFLVKLQLKESTKGIRPSSKKIKTDCLIRKDSKGEDYFYRGELDLEGKFNGYGELYLRSGKKYEGKFKDGKLNDYGRLIDLFGIKCYEGYFKDNSLLDGKGKIIEIKEDGSKIVYEGDIKNMKREGNGIETKDDYTYMGPFRNDLKHGHGKVTFNDGIASYEGDFNNGKMTGKGIYQWKNRDIYEGDFVDGKMHGKGKYKYFEGATYEGYFVNNLREGKGVYTKKDGRIYKGNYKAGKQHGKGVIINKNGEEREVEYFEGKLVKKGKIYENEPQITEPIDEIK